MAEYSGTSGDKGLQTLKVWQRSLDFAEHVCKTVLPQLPAEEGWALASQLRRAVQSIPANIAEGYGRYYYQDGIRFCYIARGSLEETGTHLALAHRLEYISEDAFKALEQEINEIRQLINGYVRFLKRSKRGENEPGAQGAIREADELYLEKDPYYDLPEEGTP